MCVYAFVYSTQYKIYYLLRLGSENFVFFLFFFLERRERACASGGRDGERGEGWGGGELQADSTFSKESNAG